MEQGGASNVLAVCDYANVPLASSARELTPFQRLFITKEAVRVQEKMDEERDGLPSSSGHIPNSAHSGFSGGMGEGDTVTYINEHAN